MHINLTDALALQMKHFFRSLNDLTVLISTTAAAAAIQADPRRTGHGRDAAAAAATAAVIVLCSRVLWAPFSGARHSWSSRYRSRII